MLDKQTKCLILIIAGLILLYLVHKYYSSSCSKVTSETTPEQFDSQLLVDNTENNLEMFAVDEDSQSAGSGSQSMGSDSHTVSSEDSYQKKLLSKNSSPTKKQVSFVADQRGNNPNSNELDVFFNAGNPYSRVTDYLPNDDKGSGGWQAVPPSYGSEKKQTTKDLFNINNYMPSNKRDSMTGNKNGNTSGGQNDDMSGGQDGNWFDSMPESISVKNRHLINITKAVGNNTVGSSLKNPSYDIRGNEACPKFVVSPWLQSSIEPDINIKSWC